MSEDYLSNSFRSISREGSRLSTRRLNFSYDGKAGYAITEGHRASIANAQAVVL